MSDTSNQDPIEKSASLFSFLGDLIGGIPVVGPILKDIGGAIVDGVKTVGSALTDAGISGLTGVVASLTSGIGSLVDGISTTLGSIIDPITSIVGSVSGLANDIETKIVGPIITPITTTITQISGLTSTIGKLVDQGLPGILAIPKALADSLAGVQTAWADSTRMLADSQQKVASETLVPGISNAVSPGLKDIHAGIIGFSGNANYAVDSVTPVELTDTADLQFYKTKLGAFLDGIQNKDGMIPGVARVAYDFVSLLPFILGSLDSIKEDASAAAKALNPSSTLDSGTVLDMFRKGILSEDSARTELLHSGLDNARQTALLEATQYLPSSEQAVLWWLRGLIADDQLAKVIKGNGGNDADVETFKAASKALVSPQILLDWLARGIIDATTFDDQLKAQGYGEDQIKQILKGGLAPAQVTTLINAKANLYAGLNGWFDSTYGSTVPDDLVNAANANRIDLTEAAAQWTSHWAVMPISMAVELFFRGHMSRLEVQYVVGQNNYPPDMVDLFISAQQELIAPRTVPTLYARGSISELEARADLQARGYQDADINMLLDDAKAQFAAKKKPAPSATTHLTIAEITEAHTDGLITDTEFTTLMGEHGFTTDEVGVLAALNNYKVAKQAKKDLVATLKAEVALGTKTVADVQTQLASSGFTPTEIERVVASIHQAKKQAAKLPSLAEMASMAKHSLITQDELLAGVQALGYAAPWDQRLVSLTFTPGASNVGSSVTT